VAELKRRIDLLEQRQAPGRFEVPPAGRPVRGNPAVVDAYKKRLLDPSQAERSRAQALLSLRLQGANKTDDVVDSGLALLAQSKDPAIRTLVLRGLQGAENPRVVSPAITLLGSDPDENTRHEAAGILSGFVGQPEVKVALESAASNDASDRVRNRALSALGQSK
jgi:HEAT repeat protein